MFVTEKPTTVSGVDWWQFWDNLPQKTIKHEFEMINLYFQDD